MHSIRVLRLTGQNRKEYIRSELEELTVCQLNKVLKSYGVLTKMTKEDAIEHLTTALLDWAYKTELGLEALNG